MKKYFKLDSRKVTYREYWNIARSWKVIIPWTAKLLGVPMNFSSGLPYFETLKELEVPEEQFSERGREKLQPMIDVCRRLGFHTPVYCKFESMHGDTCTSFITMAHPSGAAARLTYSVSLKVQPPKERLQILILSELGDGTFLLSTKKRQEFLTAPGILVNRIPGASPEKIIESHLQKLAGLPLNNSPKRAASADDVIGIWDRYEKHSNDFGFQRGIYVWMNPEETAREHQHLATATTMAAGNEQDVGVLIELNKLQERKASWTGMAILFVVSLVLFIGAGTRRWSMDYLVILLGVVVVHELGHYLAMRTFNYRNVRMFFIPFFGAAVSGRHYNVPGWKKAVVSLMGPVPGIYLALIVGGLGWYLHQPILFKIALVSLLLNGSNLVPVLPLDGGWVFHSLLFSRHYMLDVVFRALAVVALIAAAAGLKSKSLMYVAILMLISLPASYRMVRVAGKLKQRGFAPLSEDDQTIPPATAQAIIAEVRQATSKPQSNKTIAQQTLHIFEMLNARPPGWGATIGLLFLQCVSIAIAAFFAIVFLLGQNWSMLNFARGFGGPPSHKLVVEQMQTWKGGSSDNRSEGPGAVLVATFRNSAGALAAFQDITNRLPSGATLKLFGDSLLLSLPADGDLRDSRREWQGELRRRAGNAFAEATNQTVIFSLSCVAPDTNAAAELADDLHGYFDTLPGETLVPPWQPGDIRSAREMVSNNLARQTWIKLENVESEIEDDTNLEVKADELETAQDEEASNVVSLELQVAALKDKLYRQNLPRLLKGEEGAMDTNVMALFIALNTGGAATNDALSEAIREKAAQRMGRLTGRGADCFCARSGFAVCSGEKINLSFISFDRADDGPPALAAWLREKGCDDFKYSLVAMPGDGN